jgi:AhpD family alkylhydroperoxidase
MSTWFTDHTVESAPPAARRAMTGVRNERGYVPAAVARMAASPQLLDGFLRLSKMFEGSTLDPLAREVVVMAIATRNDCHVCVAMHSARLTGLGAEPDLISALRSATPLRDTRLETVRAFTLRVLDTAGAVGDEALSEFLGNGFTPQQALEVVLGIGAYTMSTLANRLTEAPVDAQLSASSTSGGARSSSSTSP